MKAWWEGRSAREQALLAVAGAMFALLAAWGLLLHPITNWTQTAAERADEAESGYRLVARAAANAAPQKNGDVDGATPVRNAVVKIAGDLNIELSFVNATPDGVVEIQGNGALPSRVFTMFSSLQNKNGIRILSADIARNSDNPSTVRFQATLSR